MDDGMTWEEKLVCIKALDADACLRMREPGNWYVCGCTAEVREGRVGLLSAYGNGSTPAEAVEDHWRKWTTGQILIKNAAGPDRTEWRWNGGRWGLVNMQAPTP